HYPYPQETDLSWPSKLCKPSIARRLGAPQFSSTHRTHRDQYSSDGYEPRLQEPCPRPIRLCQVSVPLAHIEDVIPAIAGERRDVPRTLEGDDMSDQGPPPIPRRAAPHSRHPRPRRRTPRQAPRNSRPPRLPHPVDLPRHVRRPGEADDDVGRPVYFL